VVVVVEVMMTSIHFFVCVCLFIYSFIIFTYSCIYLLSLKYIFPRLMTANKVCSHPHRVTCIYDLYHLQYVKMHKQFSYSSK
jgi:hypothetical protein